MTAPSLRFTCQHHQGQQICRTAANGTQQWCGTTGLCHSAAGCWCDMTWASALPTSFKQGHTFRSAIISVNKRCSSASSVAPLLAKEDEIMYVDTACVLMFSSSCISFEILRLSGPGCLRYWCPCCQAHQWWDLCENPKQWIDVMSNLAVRHI